MADDYIKREDAVNAVYHHCPSLTMIDAQSILHEAPSVDAVEVVRCRDCRYLYEDTIDGIKELWCGVWTNATTDDAYCSWGKKRKEQ